MNSFLNLDGQANNADQVGLRQKNLLIFSASSSLNPHLSQQPCSIVHLVLKLNNTYNILASIFCLQTALSQVQQMMPAQMDRFSKLNFQKLLIVLCTDSLLVTRTNWNQKLVIQFMCREKQRIFGAKVNRNLSLSRKRPTQPT